MDGKIIKKPENERDQIRRMAEVLSGGERPSYHPFFDLPNIENIWIKQHAKDKKYDPGTIPSYLLTVGHFMEFLISSRVTPEVSNTIPVPDLTIERMNVCRDEVGK